MKEQILVRAWDSKGGAVKNDRGETDIAIDLNLERLDAARSAIQSALVSFGALTTAHTGSPFKLSVD